MAFLYYLIYFLDYILEKESFTVYGKTVSLSSKLFFLALHVITMLPECRTQLAFTQNGCCRVLSVFFII